MLPIIYLEETTSTNSYLKELLLNAELEEGIIVTSKRQTAGRGQRGNSWESEQGENLTFSMLIYPHFVPIDKQFVISQFVSLAIKDVLSRYTPDITIKWPNDIYWQNKKICGILIENALSENEIANCIIGIGLNINQKQFVSNAPNPISLKMITGGDYDLEEILQSIQTEILHYYSKAREQTTDHITNNYKNNLFRKEGYHLYSDGEKEFEAKIKDVLATGHLVLETRDGNEKIFAFKEVKYVL